MSPPVGFFEGSLSGASSLSVSRPMEEKKRKEGSGGGGGIRRRKREDGEEGGEEEKGRVVDVSVKSGKRQFALFIFFSPSVSFSFGACPPPGLSLPSSPKKQTFLPRFPCARVPVLVLLLPVLSFLERALKQDEREDEQVGVFFLRKPLLRFLFPLLLVHCVGSHPSPPLLLLSLLPLRNCVNTPFAFSSSSSYR